ncbi:hypothetical protein JFV29_13120 [Peribacillus sp. TH16]|uniref:hypothetical protein n=1 Tax=Peribacillus sp. TH16 TaxID=2798482 RepID=UPI0019113513|nr:hypothetical protein [Peribacillus sp. TH16]MBK5482819.1 hypothetical protein [Peribacillus sp. TH16]
MGKERAAITKTPAPKTDTRGIKVDKGKKTVRSCPIIFKDKELAWVWNGVIKKNP